MSAPRSELTRLRSEDALNRNARTFQESPPSPPNVSYISFLRHLNNNSWRDSEWHAVHFYLIQTSDEADPGIDGAMQERREIVKGKPIFGFECTIGVDSIDDTIAAIDKNGGRS